MIHEVVLMIEALEHDLFNVFDMRHETLPSIIHIAAKAALLVMGKYSDPKNCFNVSRV